MDNAKHDSGDDASDGERADNARLTTHDRGNKERRRRDPGEANADQPSRDVLKSAGQMGRR